MFNFDIELNDHFTRLFSASCWTHEAISERSSRLRILFASLAARDATDAIF
jgi:hypothetical protein